MDESALKERAYLDMKSCSIYAIKNKVNDKVYIGQTSQEVRKRFMQHLKPCTLASRGNYKFYKAIKELGKENFYYEILEKDVPKSKAKEREIYYIEKYDSYENGYNSTPGGDSRFYIYKQDDLHKLKDLYIHKTKYKSMAKLFGVNKETVKRTVVDLGLPLRTNRITKEYLEDNLSTKTNIEMAEEMNVHPETISRAIKRHGFKRGKGCNNFRNPQNQKKGI